MEDIFMKTFIFQGDSITDAGRNRDDIASLGQGYPNVVGSIIGAKKPGEYRFQNEGVSGDRVIDMYARIKRDCLNYNPDILTILIGVNDVWHEFHNEPNGIDNDKYFRLYCEYIEEVKRMLPDIRILIIEPFVLRESGTTAHWGSFRKEVEKRAASAKKVAERYGLEFLPLQKKLDDLVTEECPVSYWLRDGVHPTPAGHGFIANEIISTLGL